NMGWMHDTLKYFEMDPVYRKHHHNELTFSMAYAFSENFMLSLSHDEVVHGKGSMLQKMPGDTWQKFANLRLLYGYMYAHPGKKLMFMGSEIGQGAEWNHDDSLAWHLLEIDAHRQLQHWIKELNTVYRHEKALYHDDFSPNGMEWIDHNDWQNSVLTFMRKGPDKKDTLMIAANFTPVPRYNYHVGAPSGGFWKEILNSDAQQYGGSGLGNLGGVEANPICTHGRYHSLTLTLPPLSVIILKRAE
ncbi:MAG: alpha amylase C-terminal domain-containing protein, partial [Candidatus Omnitrophica bacterium]|nr:alpha amylase C-terminal domain-containing protein [Candidatus Omnitrophota bacterium]